LTELVARDPQADLYLIVQDDVVFSQGTNSYLCNFRIPPNCGVISLFCAQCNNGPYGWHPFPAGYGMAGAQALAFPRDAAFEFLGHPWTANHRRSSPKSNHFRGDGLHHIDGAVGEWCRLTGKQAITHSPSLSQHIGYQSAMYPGFTGKRESRYADSFPGEALDASAVYPMYARYLQRWINAGANPAWSITGHLWATISNFTGPSMRTLECGSGLSTSLFVHSGCIHTALEHDQQTLNILRTADDEAAKSVLLRPLEGEPRWYDWLPDAPFDVILIDGPPGTIGRAGILSVLDRLVHNSTIIFCDDAGRRDERQLVTQIAARLGWPTRFSTAGNYGYACIAKGLPPLSIG
jgi:hypothetical protein